MNECGGYGDGEAGCRSRAAGSGHQFDGNVVLVVKELVCGQTHVMRGVHYAAKSE